MCCLKFESNCYREAKADLPLIGSLVRVDGKEGKIVDTIPLKETLIIQFTDGSKREVLLGAVEEIILKNEPSEAPKSVVEKLDS